MNHTEHTMPRAGRTVDRQTVSPGWAGFHYRGPSLLERVWRAFGWLCTFGLLAFIGVLLAARG
jgi:hypothetical protein